MKESIDLTEHRDFRGNVEKSPVVYPHKKVPWKKTTGDFDLADRQSNYVSTMVNHVILDGTETLFWNSSSFDNRHLFQRDDEPEEIFDELSTTFSLSRDREVFSSSGIRVNTTIQYNWTDATTIYFTDNNGFSSIKMKDSFKTFPTGNRDYIRSHRLIEVPVTSKYKKKQCYCSDCKAKIPRTPWNDDSTMWHPLCSKCKEKELKTFNSKDRWYTENIGKGSRSRSYKIKLFAMVPCLSQEFPMEKLEKDIPNRYIEWRDMYTPDFIYGFFDRRSPKDIKSKAVYYKGREERRREEPWQPNGRVRQDYDSIFNNTDWRDMLRKRIGVLDRESILNTQPKDGLITINTRNDDLIFIS